MAATEKAGWVIKEGGRFKTWRKRWLVLEPAQQGQVARLAYYKKEVLTSQPYNLLPFLCKLSVHNLTSKTKAIKEKCGVIVLVPGTKVQGGVEYKNKKNCFQIHTEHRVYAFTTRTETELWWWVSTLNDILDPGMKANTNFISDLTVVRGFSKYSADFGSWFSRR